MGELQTRIQEQVAEGRWLELRDGLAGLPPPEIAELLAGLGASSRAVIFRLLPRPLAGDVFSHLDGESRNALLKELTDTETHDVLVRLRPDDRTHLFEELPGRAIQRLLNLLSPEELRQARALLGYPEDSVGRLMTPQYVAVRAHWTVDEALRHVRSKGGDPEVISVIYVTDDEWKLVDALEIQRFVLAEPSQRVESIMDRRYAALGPYDDREKAVQTMLKYDLVALPVIDSEGVLLGVVTVDDVFDAALQEVAEDFERSAAVNPLRVSYREAGAWWLYRKRVPWLAALVLVNLVASGVLAAHEQTLASSIALAFFIPLLMASAGNAGAQSATLMIRALATGDLAHTSWLRTVGKEAAVGIALGATMAAAAWLLGLLRGGPGVARTVALAMLAIVVVGNFIGALLPYLLTRLRIDPAVASNPLITSLADISSLLIYFTLARRILEAG